MLRASNETISRKYINNVQEMCMFKLKRYYHVL
ncbi:hypothetical protein C818_02580 [Lachnospiraceae bacterium MD308]|nr:hypothetical protein C818_02580 [Lachnospiraceae bacterium MD308]